MACFGQRNWQMVLGLLNLSPLASTFCLGTELPHKETRVLLLETMDTQGDRPWRMRDHRERTSPHGEPWHSRGQQAAKPQTCKWAHVGSTSFSSALQPKPRRAQMFYPCLLLTELLSHGIMSKMVVVQDAKFGGGLLHRNSYTIQVEMCLLLPCQRNIPVADHAAI